MKKKKSKKNKKNKLFNYKYFVIIGAAFHFIVYNTYYVTLYNEVIFWLSALFCGLFFGFYFIKKMNLLNSKSYRKIDGIKLKIYMSFICLIMIVGGIVIFGSVLNGTILGLNYIGKNDKASQGEYKIQRIVQNTMRTRSGVRTISRKNVPRVYFEKKGEIIAINLKERYNPQKDYSEYKVIVLNYSEGLLGFDIINSSKVKK